MADRLDELEQEMVVDLLRAWIDVYAKGQAAYDGFPPEVRAHIDQHGYRVEGLVTVVAFMQPEVRVICRALVEDALRSLELSRGVATVDPAVEQVIAQAKSGEAMHGEETVEDRLARLEALAADNQRLVSEILERLGDEESPPGSPSA